MSDSEMFITFCKENGFECTQNARIYTKGCAIFNDSPYAMTPTFRVYEPHKVSIYADYKHMLNDYYDGKFKILSFEEYNQKFDELYRPLYARGYHLVKHKDWACYICEDRISLPANINFLNTKRGVKVTYDPFKKECYTVSTRNTKGKYEADFANSDVSFDEMLKLAGTLTGLEKIENDLTHGQFIDTYVDDFEYVNENGVACNMLLKSVIKHELMYCKDQRDFRRIDGDLQAVNATDFYIVFSAIGFDRCSHFIAFDFELKGYIKLISKPGGRDEYYRDKSSSFALSKSDYDMIKLYNAKYVKF